MGGSNNAVSEHGRSAEKSLNQGLFDDPRFQAKMIPAALRSLLTVLSECRLLLQTSRTGHPQPSPLTTQGYGKQLSVRERKKVDEAINQFENELNKEIEMAYERIKSSEQETIAADSIYPLSPEAEQQLTGLLFNDAARRISDKYLSIFYDDELSTEYFLAKLRLGPDSNREVLLGTALLPLVVSKAEEFIGALVRAGLSLYPSALGDPPSVPNEIIIKYQRNISSSDIKRWQIDHQVAAFLRNSPNDWRKSIERWTKVDIADLGADWEIVNEMVQRRHAVIHNGGRADSDYLAKIAGRLKQGLYPGSLLLCNSAYLEPVMIELETWATCIALRFSKNFFKKDPSIYSGVINTVTRLQGLGRWTQALAILDSFLLEPVPLKQDDIILAQINRWFCLQELGRDNESIQREIRAWRAEQSMKQEEKNYREIGRLALLREYNELVAALNSYLAGPNVQTSKRRFGEMPLMKRAMEESRLVKAFFRGGGQSQGTPRRASSQKREVRRHTRRK